MSEGKRALILGIGGQDGSYLADLLLSNNYEVHGVYRKSSVGNLQRIRHLAGPDGSYRVKLHQGDIIDTTRMREVIGLGFHEVYNMADQDSVTWSFDNPDYQWDVTAGAVGRLLNVIHKTIISNRPKFFQPVSATMFGNAPAPQTETTPPNPLSPYACAKAAAYHICRYYRQVCGIFVSCGIMYNHDSPRRKPDYICQKIARGAYEIYKGRKSGLLLGNLETKVDVGWAPEYMAAVYKIMQHSEPDDFIVSSGEAETLADLCRAAFNEFGMDYREYVRLDANYFRPDTGQLFGDRDKINIDLNWESNFTATGVTNQLCKHLKEQNL